MSPRISVVLPTKNEQSSIEGVLHSIKKEFKNHPFELQEMIIVDDSQDSTREKALNLGATVIHGGSKGLGWAMKKGLKYAAQGNPDIILSMDSDGQADISELPRFVKPIIDGQADMVIASRFLNKGSLKYPYPYINRQGVRILAFILRSATVLPITDSHGGFRALVPEVAQKLYMLGSHTYVQETIMDAHENGFRIKEVPSDWHKRDHGSSRVVGSIPKYIVYTLPALLIRMGWHVKVLLPLSLLSILGFMVTLFLGVSEEPWNLPLWIPFNLLLGGISFLFFSVLFELLRTLHIKRDQR